LLFASQAGGGTEVETLASGDHPYRKSYTRSTRLPCQRHQLTVSDHSMSATVPFRFKCAAQPFIRHDLPFVMTWRGCYRTEHGTCLLGK